MNLLWCAYIPSNYNQLTSEQKSRRVNKLTKFYSFVTFETFAKKLNKYSDEYIISTFSNKIIVIDEVHNLSEKDDNFNKDDLNIYKEIHRFLHLVKNCKILIGNSSSGIHEAASFLKPVINIGNRQNGRLKPKNVIDAQCNSKEILSKINYALKNKKFIKSLKKLKNPYGDGKSAIKIINLLKKISLEKNVIQKKITY